MGTLRVSPYPPATDSAGQSPAPSTRSSSPSGADTPVSVALLLELAIVRADDLADLPGVR
jgi:hypothetical protein